MLLFIFITCVTTTIWAIWELIKPEQKLTPFEESLLKFFLEE